MGELNHLIHSDYIYEMSLNDNLQSLQSDGINLTTLSSEPPSSGDGFRDDSLASIDTQKQPQSSPKTNQFNEFFQNRGVDPSDLMNQSNAGDDDEMKSIDLSQPAESNKDSKQNDLE